MGDLVLVALQWRGAGDWIRAQAGCADRELTRAEPPEKTSRCLSYGSGISGAAGGDRRLKKVHCYPICHCLTAMAGPHVASQLSTAGVPSVSFCMGKQLAPEQALHCKHTETKM